VPLDRRSFLSRGAAGAAGLALLGGGAGTLLGACGSDGDSSSSSGGSSSGGGLGTLSYQLMWIKNTEFAGQYVADSGGFYEGFDKVDLIAGGPTVTQDAVVEAGKAVFGVSDPNVTAAAILKGADLVIVGAVYQKNPFAICSTKADPIPNPQAMIGKKIGVQATNEVIWNAFLKANDLVGANITKVPVQFDPQPLINGEVDGWFSYFTNEPNTLRIQGVEPEVFLLADYGFPITGQNQIVKRSFLEKNRDAVKAALLGDIKGWRGAVADPQLPVDLAVNDYGKDEGLDPAKELLQSKDQNTLVLTPETAANGICTISPALQKQVIDALALVDLKIDAGTLFDLSVVEEIYAANPDLKKPPA
jgi:ABC-type nitrate/sulfonate/bicarbonate transport system substrate-binding protein